MYFGVFKETGLLEYVLKDRGIIRYWKKGN